MERMSPFPVRRTAWAIVLAAVAACAERVPPPCVRRCTDVCPSGEMCSAGFCAREGDTCEPTFESVSTGTGVACALDQLHRMWCWGDNAHELIESSDLRTVGRAFVVGDDRWDSISLGGG